MELTAGESILKFDKQNSILIMQGSMRLANLTEYDKVLKFLNEITNMVSDVLTVDMKNLTFLNSSGITTLSMYILGIKKIGKPKIIVLGSNKVSWQDKSLNNFHKLWADVTITIE